MDMKVKLAITWPHTYSFEIDVNYRDVINLHKIKTIDIFSNYVLICFLNLFYYTINSNYLVKEYLI